MTLRSILVGVVLALCGVLPPAGAQQRLGSEFQVNTYTPNQQRFAWVAVLPTGEFVIAWQSFLEDGSDFGVFARRFSAAGAALASEFQVNSYTTGIQRYAGIATRASGDFVIVWQSTGQDGDGGGVFAQLFSSAGAAQASEFQVNTNTVDFQAVPRVASQPSGEFVVTWTDGGGQDGSQWGIFARRFTSAGVALATEFQVNTYATGNQSNAVPGAGDSGDFVIAWYSDDQDGSGRGIFAQRFSSTGAALATEFQVNSYTNNTQSYPAVSAAASGDFVVVWHSYFQDGYNFGIFGQRFSSAGARLGPEFRVNTHTGSAEDFPYISSGDDGDFIVVWESLNQDFSDFGVFGRSFSSAGEPLASEFQINTYTNSAQRYPNVGAAASGDFVVAWHGPDADGDGIHAQRFASPKDLDIDGDGVITALTDGLLVLRSTFTFTGAVLVSGAVNLNGCTRCDAPAIEAYLATLK